jgi:hypothetical protein
MTQQDVSRALKYYNQYKEDKTKIPSHHLGVLLLIYETDFVKDYVAGVKDKTDKRILNAFLSNKSPLQEIKKINNRKITLRYWFRLTSGSKHYPGLAYQLWVDIKRKLNYCPYCDKMPNDGGVYRTSITSNHCEYCSRNLRKDYVR